MKKNDDILSIRITDLGAMMAIEMTINALLHVSMTEGSYGLKTIKQLKNELKKQLEKYIYWIEKRERDGTLIGRYTNKELNSRLKNAKEVLSWKIRPPKKNMAEIENEMNEMLAYKKSIEPTIKKVKILIDTNLLFSYIVENDSNHLCARTLIGYLRPQQKYFELYLPNFVFFELVSKLKKHFVFNKVKKVVDDLIEDINPKNVYTGGLDLNILQVYERYKLFSKKKISSVLKGNDFVIATEGILSNALILTCDRQFYKNCKKIYKQIYFISKSKDNEFANFVKKFENNRDVKS